MSKINLSSKIFVDGADPEETRETKRLLGFVDGQTTNPTLVSKNPAARERIEKREKFTREEIYHFYKEVVNKIAKIIPRGFEILKPKKRDKIKIKIA